MFKPNQDWQRNQRKAARLSISGYRTGLLPNDDGTASVLCSLAYDLCDFYEVCDFYVRLSNADHSHIAGNLYHWDWEYTNLRVNACIKALTGRASARLDPFERLMIRGLRVRFVGWPRSSKTHATVDPEEVRGPSTLCGGRLAFHKYTQQQWTCYPCIYCRRIVDGTVPKDTRPVFLSDHIEDQSVISEEEPNVVRFGRGD